MSRTLLGIDLDSSPVGGLIEGLLEEEDLEKLADGGIEDDEDSESDDSGSAGGTRERPGSGGDRSETPNPSATTTGLDDGPGSDSDDESGGGRLARLRPLLVKLAVVAAVLGVLALVVWRYGGRIKTAVASRLGRGGDESADAESEADSGPGFESSATTGDRSDVSPARHRAKAAESGSQERPGDERGESDDGLSVNRGTGGSSETDLGALVGLAALALIAAIVRKFGEERPSDPLVDGPRPDEDDERDGSDRS